MLLKCIQIYQHMSNKTSKNELYNSRIVSSDQDSHRILPQSIGASLKTRILVHKRIVVRREGIIILFKNWEKRDSWSQNGWLGSFGNKLNTLDFGLRNSLLEGDGRVPCSGTPDEGHGQRHRCRTCNKRMNEPVAISENGTAHTAVINLQVQMIYIFIHRLKSLRNHQRIKSSTLAIISSNWCSSVS